VPAPAVIPALIAYIKVVAVKKLVVVPKGGKIPVKRDQVSHAAGVLVGFGGEGEKAGSLVFSLEPLCFTPLDCAPYPLFASLSWLDRVLIQRGLWYGPCGSPDGAQPWLFLAFGRGFGACSFPGSDRMLL
jgi:hypothetical protein